MKLLLLKIKELLIWHIGIPVGVFLAVLRIYIDDMLGD